MPPRPRKQRTTVPAVRDPRPPSFAADANDVLQPLGFPCNVSDGGGGLAVYASRPIAAGEIILTERPLVLTVAHTARAHTCAVCLADSRTTGLDAWSVECKGCGSQSYCGERCANAAKARHCGGVECATLATLDVHSIDEDDRDAVLQAIRILADREMGHKHDIGAAGAVGPAAYTQRLVGITPCTAEAREALERICAATLRALPPEARIPAAELLDLLERHSCNLYGVSGREGEEVASASFVGFFHLLNHSCAPNVVFDSARPARPAQLPPAKSAEPAELDEAMPPSDALPPTYALVALEDIACGSELCISYTSSAEGPSQRAAHLQEHYGFACSCVRCACDDVAAELDYCDRMDALRCTVDGCGSGLGVPAKLGGTDLLRCVHCGDEFEPDT